MAAAKQWMVWLILIVAALLPAQAQEVFYVHTDALGTVVAETDANGNVVRRSEYEPYGRVLNRPVTNGPGFTGHVEDAATGLTYMQQRYYDPVLGVFLSVDPVTPYSDPVGQFHRYRYANNNPYRFTDPDGRIGYEVNSGGNMAVIIPVYFQGSGATDQLTSRIVSHANSLAVEGGINIRVVQAQHLVDGVNVMNLAPHSANPNTTFGEGVVAVPGHSGNFAAHINSAREDVVGAAVHDIMHFVDLADGYKENASSTFGNRGPSTLKPGFSDDQIMASTGGNQIRSSETGGLRGANNGLRSGVEFRRVEGRLDAKRQESARTR